jgi:hypothetical protein
MVFNMAPIGCYPAFLVELPHNGNDLYEYGCMTTYNSAVVYYNELLNNSLARDRKTLQDASIAYVDKYSIMLELFQHPEAHGKLPQICIAIYFINMLASIYGSEPYTADTASVLSSETSLVMIFRAEVCDKGMLRIR